MLVDSAVDGELPDEATKRQEELATLLSLVHPDLEQDKGANVSGLYELVGIVTHKGASADGGERIPTLELIRSFELILHSRSLLRSLRRMDCLSSNQR